MRWWLLLMLFLVCVPPSEAQTSTATLFGTVTDPQGKIVADAVVLVRGGDLATTRSVRTNQNGAFSIAGLVPGAYVLEAHTQSLRLKTPLRLTLSLGSSTELQVRLVLPVVQQKAHVFAQGATSEGNTLAPAMNTTEAAVSSFLPGLTVTYLPNRDRDVTQFEALVGNTHPTADDDGVSIDGQRATSVATVVDGMSFIDALSGLPFGSETQRLLLPQTVVREMQIVTSGVDATTAGTNAGLVNVATKEGSNKFHGEAFYTARPGSISSADAFGHAQDAAQQTFGGSIGGPIRHDRLFYYVGIEQDYLTDPTYVAFAPQATSVPAALGALQGEVDGNNHPLALFGRIDAVLSPRTALNAEIIGNRTRAHNLSDGFSRSLASSDAMHALGEQSLLPHLAATTLLTPNIVNELRLSWSQDHRATSPNALTPTLAINGLGQLGGDPLGREVATAQAYQSSEHLTWTHGKNLFIFGGNDTLAPTRYLRAENTNARFDYNSLADFVAHHPRRYQQTFVTADMRAALLVQRLDLFTSAHISLRPALVLTAGLLWSGQWNPQPAQSNPALPQTQHVPNDLNSWQPRVGLAWQPRTHTVARASAGLYVATTPTSRFYRTFADNGLRTDAVDSYFDPQLLLITGAYTAEPQALTTVPTGITMQHAYVAGVASNFRNPTSAQVAVSIEQLIADKLTLQIGYLHASTWRLGQTLDDNLAAPSIDSAGLPVFAQPRPIPTIGRLVVEHSSAHASYDGLNLATSMQISRRSSFSVQYTLAQNNDDSSTDAPYGISGALSPFNLAAERGRSSLDLRHTLSADMIYNLPLGFKFNPLLLYHSGAPYTALIGFDTQNDANDFNDRAIVNDMVTRRNAFAQPAFTDTDLRLVKDFTLKGQGHHLDLFMDVFNVFGASNRSFGADQVSFYGNASSPVYSAGLPLYSPGATQSGGARMIQFTARLVAF
jgi:hypothetical protein